MFSSGRSEMQVLYPYLSCCTSTMDRGFLNLEGESQTQIGLDMGSEVLLLIDIDNVIDFMIDVIKHIIIITYKIISLDDVIEIFKGNNFNIEYSKLL